MLFNSIEFAIFLPLIFTLYWFIFHRNIKIQNLFIDFVSYLFYGWLDWRFFLLIAFTTLASYFSGIGIEVLRRKDNQKMSKYLASANVILNILRLCVFKYFNFFGDNLAKLFSTFGFALDWFTVDI